MHILFIPAAVAEGRLLVNGYLWRLSHGVNTPLQCAEKDFTSLLHISLNNRFLCTSQKCTVMNISENSRKSYVVDLANDIFCNFPPEALMNTFFSYKAVYWLQRIFLQFSNLNDDDSCFDISQLFNWVLASCCWSYLHSGAQLQFQ